jgi:hypothetical protein
VSRQSVAGQLLPGQSAVDGFIQPAARSAAGARPGLKFELPHAREKNVRIVRIHDQIGAAGVLIHLQHLRPALAPVAGSKHAALRLRAISMSQCACEHDVGIFRIHNHTRDAAGFFEPHQVPGLARIERLINALPNGDMAANERFAGARPHDVRIAAGNGKRADGGHRLPVEDRFPMRSAIGRFENTARSCARIIDAGIAGNTHRRIHSIPDRTDIAIAQTT